MPEGMPQELKKVWITGGPVGERGLFYMDDRLEQYRNVDNPNEFYEFQDLDMNPDVIMTLAAVAAFPSTQEERAAQDKANDELRTLVGNSQYFDHIPLADITAILDRWGFDTDAIEGIYTGEDGATDDQVGPKSWLHLRWHKMAPASDRYEIVVYVN